MLCSKCGEKNRRKESFCVSCGTVLKYPCSNGGGETSSGLAENMASVIAYAGTWASGLFFFFTEQKNKVVRFHAMQSILVFLPITVILFVLRIIKGAMTSSHYGGYFGYAARYVPFAYLPAGAKIVAVLSWLVWIGAAALYLYLIMKANKGETYKLPVVGEIAAKQLD